MNLDRCFVIAEMSANHGSKLEIALETVRAAARAGADAIKLQTYRGDTITMDSKTQDFLIEGTLWDGRYLYDLYEEAHLPWEWHKAIFDEAKKEGLVCFSSPFDFSAVDFLEKLECPIYKIASFEITDIPLIEYVASKGKPVIISTGIADDEDIQLAVDSCRKMGNNNITLLKCTSSYPAPIELANLSMIPDLAKKFDVYSGLSDHTEGIVAPVVAVSLGAKVIEKHFILDKSVGGPDASFSLDEGQFTEMVKAVRDAEKAIGKIDYALTENQKQNRRYARSLYLVSDIKAGDKFTEENIRSIRPGFGLHPKYFKELMGNRVNKNKFRGERLSEDDFLDQQEYVPTFNEQL